MDGYIHTSWPAWFYGPNGEAAIFEEHDEIPDGWNSEPFTKETTDEESLKADAEAADEAQEGEVLSTPRRGRPRKTPTEADF